MPEETITVLLVNDHSLFRSGVRKLLSSSSHIQIVGEAENYPSMYEQLARTRPDILFTDDQMPGGLSTVDIPKIAAMYPSTKIIVTSLFRDRHYLNQLLPHIHGLLNLASETEYYVKAIESVRYGGMFFYIPG